MVEALSGGRWQGSSTADADPDKTSSQFASGTWTSQGDSGILSESSGVITLSVDSADDNKDSGFTFDLGSGNVSDSTWTLRTKFIYTSNNISPNNQAFTVAFGIADSTTISGEGETNGNDIINPTIHFQDNTNNCYMVIDSTPTAGNNRTTRMTIGDTYYLQVQRVSADLAEFKVFSDSTYETQVGTTSSNTTTSSLTGGRYVFVHFFSQTVSSGSISASFSEWEFWNGLPTKDEKTTLTNVPANTRYEETDTRKIYRRKINTGSGLYWGIRTNDKSYYDLGSGNVSDSSWVLRFKWTIRDIYRGTSTDFGFLGLSDSTGGKDTSQDFVGYTYNPYNNYPYDLQLQNTDGSALGLGTGDSSGSAYSLANDTWSNGSTYYYELIRNSTTLTLKIYDNANYTGTPTTISKTIGSESGLRYLVQCGDNSRADTKTGHIGGEIGDVQFYNGQTSATTLTKTITRFDWTNAGQNSSEIYQQGQQTNSNANVSYLTYKQITGLTAGDLISAVTFDAYSYSSTAFKGGVYTDSSNQPSSLLGSGTLASDSLSNTYTTVTITLDSAVEVPSDGKVWVAVIPNTTNPNFRVTTESGGAYTHSVYATDSSPSGRSTNYANMLYSTANISGNGSNNVRFGVVINKGKWIERGKTA